MMARRCRPNVSRTSSEPSLASTSPSPYDAFSRLDFGPEEGIATTVPPKVGKPYPCLVPAVDQDGNEVCGVRFCPTKPCR